MLITIKCTLYVTISGIDQSKIIYTAWTAKKVTLKAMKNILHNLNAIKVMNKNSYRCSLHLDLFENI